MIRFSAIIADGTFPCATAVLQGSAEETFRKAREAGYDCVQLTMGKVTDYDREECRRLMERYGLGISAIATGQVYLADGLSMAAGDESARRACMERLRSIADYSAALGKPAIVLGAVRGRFRDAASPEEYHRQLDRSMRELLDYCERLDVPVILEAFNHVDCDAYWHPEETLRYVQSFHSGVFHMYMDTMHLFVEELDAPEMIRRYGKDAYSIDISGEDRISPVLSKMDFPAIVRAIRESGFDGTLTFELRPSPPEDSARVSLDYIKALLNET